MSLFGAATPFQLEWLGAFWVTICLVIVASLVVFILVAVWLYGDAERRGMNGLLWVLLLILASLFFAFVGGIIVLFIYLILRGERPVGAMPGAYGAGYPAYGPYPPQAAPPPVPPAAPAAPGAAPAPPTTCKSCGAPLHANAAFCANCGTKV
ncbi:MAG: hypothetical protein A3K66_01310 [Euryarchaeota archaeon RBG_16_67_27]|nr:MAG: hypothetical protein A3K66_01310 [Euryarchaeota archaeon RBG_16_67_27]